MYIHAFIRTYMYAHIKRPFAHVRLLQHTVRNDTCPTGKGHFLNTLSCRIYIRAQPKENIFCNTLQHPATHCNTLQHTGYDA